jgi:hypothetical protein
MLTPTLERDCAYVRAGHEPQSLAFVLIKNPPRVRFSRSDVEAANRGMQTRFSHRAFPRRIFRHQF